MICLRCFRFGRVRCEKHCDVAPPWVLNAIGMGFITPEEVRDFLGLNVRAAIDREIADALHLELLE